MEDTYSFNNTKT